MIHLRPYQADLYAAISKAMRDGHKNVLAQGPTGMGKTALTAEMLRQSAAKGAASIFLVHRRELVKQSIKAFHLAGVNFGVIATGFQPAKRHIVQIASVQTLVRRLGEFRPGGYTAPRLVVEDEAHHVAAGTWATLRSAFQGAYHVGLTATPQRLDGKGLDKFYSTLVQGPSVAWLIENGFLSRYRLFAPGGIRTEGVHTLAGDFNKAELAKVADRPSITGDAIAHYRKLCPSARAVVFCTGIEHSKHVVAGFNAAGIPAAHVDGETDPDERDRAIAQFTEGRIRVLSNVELFGEGFDVPAIEAAILLRPTQSLGLYLQQVGRALRPAEGKAHAYILDHAGNVQRHGLPDEDRAWTLEGRPAGQSRGESAGPPVRVCPKCFAAQRPGPPACRYCGAVFPVAARQVQQVDGDLVEVDADAIRRARKREQGQARTEAELIALAEARGYKRPRLWARHVVNARGRHA